MKAADSLALVLVVAALFGSPVALAADASYVPTLGIHLEKRAFSGSEPILVTGNYWPNMGRSVTVTITGPNGVFFLMDAYMEDDNSEYFVTFHPGSGWDVEGTYTVNAVWDTGTQLVSNRTTFHYSPAAAVSVPAVTSQASQSSLSSGAGAAIPAGGGRGLPSIAYALVAVIVASSVGLAGVVATLVRSPRRS